MSDTADEKRLRLYYVNIAIGIRTGVKKNDRSTSCGMYVAAENRESARREALASAVYSICDKPEGTMVITIVGTHEVSKEMSETLMKDWTNARPQTEIDADDPTED